MNGSMTLSAIGTVQVRDDRFVIEIDPVYRPALSGLEGFGHVNVLTWLHQFDEPMYREVVTCPRPYRRAPETVGIFATRSPLRPNPVGLTVCPVVSIDESAGLVTVGWIDAEDGTPVLDIKPYHPAVDRVRDAAVPEWCSHWPQWLEDVAAFDWEAEFVNAR